MAAKRDRCRISLEQMQSREDLVGVATSDRARASGAQGLRARLGEGPALVWWLMLRKKCHGNWGGKKYGNLEGLLITGHWDVSGFPPQEALSYPHKVPDSIAGTSSGIQGNDLSL